jgi:hypothetical protein
LHVLVGVTRHYGMGFGKGIAAAMLSRMTPRSA